MPADGSVFVFFNCDEHKRETSMNIFYNDAVYKDTRISRKRLWQKVKAEVDSGRVKIDSNKLADVEDIILTGDPVDAGKFMQFGTIKAFNCI